jgi:bis(5'-nucleosyl)-tetraphosphatase (symmetrical)
VQRVFVGDVQGCADELDELLVRVRSAFGGEFELWLVGDLVNRGPASLRVLRTVRSLVDAGRARLVLGNHELALLRAAWGQRTLAPDDTMQDVLEAPDRDEWLDWLRSWPVARVDRIGGAEFAMVHAAVAPDWTLPELARRAASIEERLRSSRKGAANLLAADPRTDADGDALGRITRCRSVDARGRWSARAPSDDADGWHRRWAAHGHDYGIVYGHWSTQGLHVAPGLRGLDSGCVYHGWERDGFLTAWLPASSDPAPFRTPDEAFWSVPARARYWRGDATSAPRAAPRP